MLDNTKTEAKKATQINMGELLYERTSNGDQRLLGEVVSKRVDKNKMGYEDVTVMAVRKEKRDEIRTRCYYKPDDTVHVAIKES